jgi:hypothetical protein
MKKILNDIPMMQIIVIYLKENPLLIIATKKKIINVLLDAWLKSFNKRRSQISFTY